MIRAHSEQTSSLRNMLNSILSPIRSILLRIPKHLISTKSINTNMAKQVIDEAKFTGVRLPKNIKPIHYDLSLKPNFEDFTFTGKVKIDFEGQELSDSVVVHANELKIIDGHVENGDQRNPLEVVTYSPATETATLTFRDSLTPLGSISINFTGILNDRMKGFYKTAFKIGETEVYAATTQFESTDARRCFPCWDEPAVKATFSVSMTIEKFMNVDGKQFERIVLSNMPETSRTDLGAELEVKFEKSPIMSTYLLAFIVGPFDVLEGTDGHRPIRVFTTPGKKEQGRFALEVTCKALPYYEDYFDIKYPLPKMDLVAIPDFMSGAMENWGLVTYRETCLLFDPATTSTDRKQYIAIVVAHELAHQWFGNLVTMEWWTHLWLNEGFASFMEYLCADHIFPEYDLWSQFVTDQYCTAMSLDALHNSHPIEVPVIHASEIDEIFDTISYSKGASVIRMLYTYIGDDNFRKGMKDYLTKFAYKNTETEDLWLCLEAASNKPVRKLMSGWTSQRGYPWLSVDYAKEGDKVKLTLTQNKFSANGALNEEDAASSWVVPISIVTGDQPNGPREICLLEGKTAEVTIDNVGDDWIKLNPGTIGLYSVRYPVEMTTKLYPAISDQTLSPMDRLNLQRDFYAFCQAGIVSSTELLQLLQAYKTETNYTVWSSIDDCIGHFKLILSDTCCAPKFQTFGCQLYNEIYQKLGWAVKEGESHTTAMLRALVIRRLVSLQDEDVTKEAMRLYKVQLEGGPQVAADLRAAVYQAASVHGDEATFSSLFDIYRKADMSEEQNRALRALGSTKDEARLQKVLDFCLSSEVRKQDKVFVIVPAAANNPQVTWKFFKDNAAFFQKEFGTCHLMTSMAKSVSQNFVSEEMAVEVGEFFEKNKFPGTERSIKQAMEKVRLNTAWLHRDREAIKAFLSSY